MAKDEATFYRETLATYGGNIAMSDFKANVAIVFVAIMMGPVVGLGNKFPSYLPMAVALLPFLIIFFCLLICLWPRYPKEGQESFIIARNADPSVFKVPEADEIHLKRQQQLCAVFSRILFWKRLMLYISFYTCILSVATGTAIMLYASFGPSAPANPPAANAPAPQAAR
jgi:hypothetical protein